MPRPSFTQTHQSIPRRNIHPGCPAQGLSKLLDACPGPLEHRMTVSNRIESVGRDHLAALFLRSLLSLASHHGAFFFSLSLSHTPPLPSPESERGEERGERRVNRWNAGLEPISVARLHTTVTPEQPPFFAFSPLPTPSVTLGLSPRLAGPMGRLWCRRATVYYYCTCMGWARLGWH